MQKRKGSAKDKITVADGLGKILDLPSGMLSNMPQIEVNGNREAIVEGCKGIIEYDTNVIRINTGSFIIKFSGDNLTLRSISDSTAIIEGIIASIDFS